MPRLDVTFVMLAVVSLGCGDDAPAGEGGSDASTTPTATTTTSASGPHGATTSTGGTGGSGGDSAGDGGAVAGAGGEGAGGGSAGGMPRPVTISIAGTPNGDGASAVVLVHGEDGTLTHELRGSDLPQTLELVDGDIVSIVDATIVSDRIAPGVDAVRVGTAWVQPCVAQTMTVLVDVPEVPGAAWYEVIAPYSVGPQASSPGVMSASVRGCDGETVDVLVAAFDVTGVVLAHEALLALPFEGGGTIETSVALDEAARTPGVVAVSSLAGAARLFAYGSWEVPGSPLFEPDHVLELVPPADDALVFAPDLVDPGFGAHILRVGVRRVVPDGCSSASIFRLGPAGADLAFDAQALRRPIEHPDGRWGWVGDGALGDTVVRGFRDGARHWTLREHPEHPAWRWAALEMPGGWSLDAEPESIRQVDYDERAGYADVVDGSAFTGTTTTRVVTTEACDP